MRELITNAPHADHGAIADITPIDSPTRRTFFRVAMIVVALEPLVICGVLMAIGMPWEIILLMIAGLILFTALVFWLLVLLIWKPLQSRYPAQPFLSGAVSQSWQSFAFGPLMRLNNCLTIVADERHLHLRPFVAMQWLGAGWISLPLDRIKGVRSSMLGMQMTAVLDGRMIAGPPWCLRLAAGALDPEAANNSASPGS